MEGSGLKFQVWGFWVFARKRLNPWALGAWEFRVRGFRVEGFRSLRLRALEVSVYEGLVSLQGLLQGSLKGF